MNLGFHFDLIPFSLIPMQSYFIFILVSFHFIVIPFQPYICIPFWSYSILVFFHFCLIQLYLFYFVHIRLKCPRSVPTYVTWILSGPNFRCVNSKAFDTQLLDPSTKDINDHSRSNSYYLVPNIMHKKDLSLGYVYYIFVFIHICFQIQSLISEQVLQKCSKEIWLKNIHAVSSYKEK